MKINEKNLSSFATSATPVDREGYLEKRGDVNKSFQKRWFVLKGNLLFYFDKRGDREPVGVIILEGCTIELADDEQYSFKIVFHAPGGRSYTLCAESQDSMEQWMKALACAGYDYMKIMVADLQRQLDEMEEAAKTSAETPVEEPKVPPRGLRYNPFNRTPETGGKCVPGSRHIKDAVRGSDPSRGRMSFRELHSMYGRRILADRNEWRMQRLKLQQKQDDQPLGGHDAVHVAELVQL